MKGLLIALVVFGHIALPVQHGNTFLSTCFDLIYLFHMPLFVFISGLFAKGAYRNGSLNVNRIISFIVLGLAFQAALICINNSEFTFRHLLNFSSAPWYLISMATWYALTPVLSHLGITCGLVFSFFVSAAWGCIDLSDGLLALSRTMAFLPYFALGYYLTPDTLIKLRNKRWPLGAVIFAGAITWLRAIDPQAFSWFFPMVYGDNPYTGSLIEGLAQKGTAIALALIYSIAVLRLTPRRESLLTTWGRRSLQIYVLHRLIRAWMGYRTQFYELDMLLDPLASGLICIALSSITIWICALPIFEKPFSRIMSITWIPGRKAAGNQPTA